MLAIKTALEIFMTMPALMFESVSLTWELHFPAEGRCYKEPLGLLAEAG